MQQVRYVTIPNIGAGARSSPLVTGVIAAAAVLHRGGGRVGRRVGQGDRRRGHRRRTLGYPDQSLLTYTQWLYVRGFSTYQLGYASALAVVLFVVAAVILIFLLRRFKAFTPEGAQ